MEEIPKEDLWSQAVNCILSPRRQKLAVDQNISLSGLGISLDISNYPIIT